MTLQPTYEQIEKVAEWWAVKTFDTAMNQNNGDDSENGALGFMLANLNAVTAKSKEATPEAREKFKQALIRQLIEDPNTYLDVDYHPSQAIETACKEAGISTNFVPIKTFTIYRKNTNSFEGRFQYSGKFEQIA